MRRYGLMGCPSRAAPSRATLPGGNSGGRGMLSIIAHQVFAQIIEISRAADPLAKRREAAEKRIVLLKIDLKSARHEPEVSDDLSWRPLMP